MPTDAPIVRKVISELDKEPVSRTFTVSHTTPGEMADMICNMLLPAHGSGVGKTGNGSGGESFVPPTPGVSTGGAAGIVTGGASDTSGIKLGEGVVACTVSQSASGASNAPFDMQNLAISYYPQRGTIMMIGGSDAQMRMVEHFIKTNDVKQPQAYLEMSIVELNEEGSKEFQNNWSVNSNAWNVSFNNGRTSGGREASPYGRWYPGTKPYWIKSTDKDTGAVTWAFEEVEGKFQDLYKAGSYISWTMNYLIENKKGRVLANPKILITNGQESVIDLTEDYVEKVTSEYLSSTVASGAATGAVERTYTIGDDKGLKITLTPFISPDGYVTMNIKPEYATEAGKIYNQTPSGNDLAATLLNRRNLDLKNVRIKDGETLVIGGMIQEGEQKTVQKIPLLGDLPLIGAAFRSSSTVKTKSELIIMITPKIIHDGDGSIADNL